MIRGNPMLPNGAGFKGMHDNKVEFLVCGGFSNNNTTIIIWKSETTHTQTHTDSTADLHIEYLN